MAFDGAVVRSLADEMNEKLALSRISKIQQTERDELLLTFKGTGGVFRVLLSASASLPMARLTEETKESLPVAPNFCMVLRKHLQNGRLLSVTTPGLERIIEFRVEHLDEMGDMKTLKLVAELMGKYSNLILVGEDGLILDAIRHVTPMMSSLRTVMPGLPYFLPAMQEKKDPLSETKSGFLKGLVPTENALQAFTNHYSGLSVLTVSEAFFSSGTAPDLLIGDLDEEKKEAVGDLFLSIQQRILNGDYRFEMALNNGMPVQFSALGLPSYACQGNAFSVRRFDSASELVGAFYSARSKEQRIREKAAELRKTLKTVIERTAKKEALQESKLKDTFGRDRDRLYGELLSAFAYSLPVGEKTVQVENYYDDNRVVSIAVDPDLSIQDNAKKYFEKYARAKRTFEAVSVQLEETRKESDELKSLLLSLDIAETEADLSEIREELYLGGFIRRSSSSKKDRKAKKSEPYHYLSRDGFHIYVGKNNLQNEALTFRFASGNDYFFHAKKTPGSHVILKTEGRSVPDGTFEDAASLAAYYSTARENNLVEVDYVLKKEVKKVPGQKPGFVIYDTNYSMMAKPDIRHLTLCS